MPQKQEFMATIVKSFTFDAAHHIPTMPDGHKCRGMHGHTYTVELVLRSVVDREQGYFIDYGEIADRYAHCCHSLLDHGVLNDIPGLEVPTTENLALWIITALIDKLPTLDRVRVHESSTTYCEVSVMELRAAGILPLPFVSRTTTRDRVSIPRKK